MLWTAQTFSQVTQTSSGAQNCAPHFSRFIQLLPVYNCILELELLQNAAKESGELGDDLLTSF